MTQPPAHVLESAAAALRDVEADLRSLDAAELAAEDLAWSPESPAGFSFYVVAFRRHQLGGELHVTLECHINRGLLRHWMKTRDVTLPLPSRSEPTAAGQDSPSHESP